MTTRQTFVAGALIGAAVIVAVTFAAGLLRGTADLDENEVELREGSSGCFVFTKSSGMVGKKDKWLEWQVKNGCTADQRFSIGNLRKVASADAPFDDTFANCASAVTSAGPYPFTHDSFDDRSEDVPAGKERTLKLKLKRESDLPGGPLYYHYDVCLGSGGERKQADPRILIEQ